MENTVYNIPVNAVSKVPKDKFGAKINVGDRIKILLNSSGYAVLAVNYAIRFSPEEYDLFIEDSEYDELLNYGDVV